MFVYERQPYWPMTNFDPDYLVECDILEYLLRKVLPSEALETAAMTNAKRPASKRQRNDDGNEPQGSGKKRPMSNVSDISDKENGTAQAGGKRSRKNLRNAIVSRGKGQSSLTGPSNVIDLTGD